MKLVETRRMLLTGVNLFFEKKDFHLKYQKNQFVRNFSNGLQILDFFFFKKREVIIIKPEIRIKISSIENIYQSISSIDGRPYCTLGNHLFEIVRYMEGGQDKGVRKEALSNWVINEKHDIEELIKVIPAYLEDSILPYFNENSSIERVDELLNQFPRELTLHNYIYPLRANIAIIAAKLNGNTDYEKLVKIYEEELEDAEETYKEEFYKIKNVLDNME